MSIVFLCLEEEQRLALCSTLTEILVSACIGKTHSFCLATWARSKYTDENGDITEGHTEPESSQNTHTQQQHQPSESLSLLLYFNNYFNIRFFLWQIIWSYLLKMCIKQYQKPATLISCVKSLL